MKVNTQKIVGAYAHTKLFLDKCSQDNIPALAAQSAFFLILSAAPFLMFAFSLLSMIFGTTSFQIKVPAVDDKMNVYAREIIQFIERSVRNSGSGTTIITAIAALWSAGKGIYCITEGISRVYQLPNKHIWLTKRIFSMGYTLMMLLVILLSFAVLMFTFVSAGAIITWAGGSRFVSGMLFFGIYILLGLALALMMTLALKLYLIKKVDDKRCRSMRALFPGMALTVVAWHLLTFGVVIYVDYFATSSIYGSLGTVIVFMMWIYLLMYLLLYGIQLDCIFSERFYGLKIWKIFQPKRKKQKQEDDHENT